ncbi:hypothetical protein RchiOBHm_Chr1g0357241 [Rosa chinensis]|uniref:Uncharacterized protein n=1 Tax=Rosa chinensis TaxID=74649 RepID=A0A2P6SHV2_ROSCH|nr:hypothetical protein RchiOBHm_Chr1g0357241 [Rosa chinensis]
MSMYLLCSTSTRLKLHILCCRFSNFNSIKEVYTINLVDVYMLGLELEALQMLRGSLKSISYTYC